MTRTVFATAGTPTEESEQMALFDWARRLEWLRPELEALYHVPNEGKRSKGTGGRMKAGGLKSGVPDVCLPVPRPPYSGLYIEMKRRGGRVTQNQKDWAERLRRWGNRVEVCYSFEDAARVLMEYLNMKGEPYHVEIKK